MVLSFILLDEGRTVAGAAVERHPDACCADESGHFAEFQRVMERLGALDYLHMELPDVAGSGMVGHAGMVSFGCRVSARKLRRRWRHGYAEIEVQGGSWAEAQANYMARLN